MGFRPSADEARDKVLDCGAAGNRLGRYIVVAPRVVKVAGKFFSIESLPCGNKRLNYLLVFTHSLTLL